MAVIFVVVAGGVFVVQSTWFGLWAAIISLQHCHGTPAAVLETPIVIK
jgi:hypothetical protein